MGTDATRQPVMDRGDLDVWFQNAEVAHDNCQALVAYNGFGGRKIGSIGRQGQLSIEEFGLRDCAVIKAPAKTVSLQVRFDEPGQFRLGDGTGEPAVDPVFGGAPPRRRSVRRPERRAYLPSAIPANV